MIGHPHNFLFEMHMDFKTCLKSSYVLRLLISHNPGVYLVIWDNLLFTMGVKGWKDTSKLFGELAGGGLIEFKSPVMH